MRHGIPGAMAVVAVAAALAAGCGSSSSSLASETPSQILAAAVSATKGATSYEISSTGSFGSGVTGFDLKVVGTSISGTYVLSGSTVDLVDVAGNIYIKAPASFYTGEGATSGEAALLAPEWVEIPASSSYASDFSSLSNFTDISSQLTPSGTVTSNGTGTVNGQAVVILKDTSGDTLAIATSGPAYPVQTKETGSTAGTFNFSTWNSVPAITAPPNPLTLPSS
ncbi:MAG: hypothetical protein ACLQGJ_13165 [Candidatus Dormibacteria bacterium]